MLDRNCGLGSWDVLTLSSVPNRLDTMRQMNQAGSIQRFQINGKRELSSANSGLKELTRPGQFLVRSKIRRLARNVCTVTLYVIKIFISDQDIECAILPLTHRCTRL